MTPIAPRPDAFPPCVPAADLTAFAQDALPELRRAEVSRHLLRCPRCHAAASDADDLLGRLRSFGAAASWQGELDAAVAIARARTRARRFGAMAGVGAGVLLAAAVALLPTSESLERGPDFASVPPSRDAHAPRAPRFLHGIAPEASHAVPSIAPALPLSDDARALLRAQAADGRWIAGDALGPGRHDEAATGLALLAILAGRPDALREAPVARAVAAATRWLTSRERNVDASPAALRDDAVTTAALLEVYAQTGDAGVRARVDRGVRRLGRAVASDALLDPASAGWARLALTRARDLGWDRGVPATETAPVAYPLGGAPGETLVAKALALVGRAPQG